MEVLQGISAALSPQLADFKFFKGTAQYRRSFGTGIGYIGLDYSHGTLAIRFGVHIEAVELLKERLFSLSPLKNFPGTISAYSWNMGPSNVWKFSSECTWPITGRDGIGIAATEILEFIGETILPYLAKHQNTEIVRDTLLRFPERSSEWGAFPATIFAIDVSAKQEDWLDADFSHYSNLAKRASKEQQQALELAYAKCKNAMACAS